MTDYLILFAIVFGVNLIPVFGPPTWIIIVFYSFNSDLHVTLLVLVAALGAALGRFMLARVTRWVGERFLPQDTRRNLEAARKLLERRKRNTVIGIGLFALSPVPSAQLFEAAGLARIRLVWFTTAFFAGRLISYAIYAAAAKGVQSSTVGDLLRNNFATAEVVAVQIVMIALLIAFTQVNWGKWLPAPQQKE